MQGYGEIVIEGARVGETLTLTGPADSNLRLWRPRPAEAVTVKDSGGVLYRARVTELGEGSSTVEVFEEVGPSGRPLEVTLLQALPEKERMGLIIEKATELGVTRIVPFESTRSITLEGLDRPQKKSHRWQSWALKASKQSRRGTISRVLPPKPLEKALEEVEAAELKITLWEGREGEPVKDVLRGAGSPESAAILAGPEGGFDPEEVHRAREKGFTPVTLGTRILRTETAALFAVGLVTYELEGA